MSDHETFCSTCASLSFTQMLTWEGQVYHENWRALEASATRGCRLCDYFRTEKDNVDNCPNLYSGTHGPLVLRIAYTDSLQLFVRSDGFQAKYSLALVRGTYVSNICKSRLHAKNPIKIFLSAYLKARSLFEDEFSSAAPRQPPTK
jgi:hypothetical protein